MMSNNRRSDWPMCCYRMRRIFTPRRSSLRGSTTSESAEAFGSGALAMTTIRIKCMPSRADFFTNPNCGPAI